jgi:hypothetical protein
MADTRRVRVNYVDSCNLGKLQSGDVALKINFATSPENIKKGPYQSAVFELSHEVAQGLATALTSILKDAPKPV